MIITIERKNIPVIDIKYIEELPAIGLLRVWFKDGNTLDINVASKTAREAYLEQYREKLQEINDRNSIIIGQTFSERMIESFEENLIPPPLTKNLH